MKVNINRQLAGLEDIAFGTGTVEQLRQGTVVTVTKINAGNLPPSLGDIAIQAVSKSTAVSIDTSVGKIIMANDTLVAGAIIYFDINNNLLLANDIVLVNSLNNNYRVEVASSSLGKVTIRVTNITSSDLTEEVVIKFIIFKGAIS